jgi:chitinase
MTTPGCTSPDCTYTGPDSTATKGECTGTAGYISNAEIDRLLTFNDTNGATTFCDKGSDSNILVYNQNQWVAYMDGDTKTSRTSWYQGLNFGGTVDWAIDLQLYTGDDGEPNYDGDDDQYTQPLTPLAPCDQSYKTMEDLDAATSGIPEHCRVTYVVATLSNMLDASLQNYTDMMKDGYDKKFHTYASAVSGSAGKTVEDFVYDNGNKYFSCMVSETTFCCGNCGTENQCKYCRHETGALCERQCNPKTGFCTKNITVTDPSIMDTEPITHIVNVTEPCPPDYSQRGYGDDNPHEQSVYWTMNDGRSDPFFADLFNQTAIPKDKIKFGTFNRGGGCLPSAQPGDDCYGVMFDYNIPMADGFGEGDVSNPKKLAQEGLDKSKDLGPQLQNAALAVKVSAYAGDSLELIDSLSMPILMIAEAIENMAQIIDIANTITEEQRKAIILAFVGAVLFFVPIAGEVLGAVTELSGLAAVIAILGAAGNAAFDIYTIVDDKENAPLAIMGLIFSPLALLDVAKIFKAASLRRGMKDEDVAKLGKNLPRRMETIKKVTGVNCKRK